MSYPKEPLSTRAIVKPGLYAVIPKDGLVNNVIPNIKDCKTSIVASPKMGASFVQYIIEMENTGRTTSPMAAEAGIESFIYVVDGTVKITLDRNDYELTEGGYGFAPEGIGISFKNIGDTSAKVLFYKQRYIPLEGHTAKAVVGNINDVEFRIYDEMENVFIKDFLPIDDLGYDMNMHILSFAPGGCHPFVETHVQEHGAYILTGEGMYLMEDTWMPIKKEDFMWFGPFVQQGAYGVGREMFSYIYSKDCNRDVTL